MRIATLEVPPYGHREAGQSRSRCSGAQPQEWSETDRLLEAIQPFGRYPEWRPDTNGHTDQLFVSEGWPSRIDPGARRARGPTRLPEASRKRSIACTSG